MPLTGELTDLSLAELLEFFCNQRKNGLLEVICPYGSGHFYLDSGAIVHAEIGTLSGIEAVHYALGLPSASFSFSAGVEPPHQTIAQSWQSVVLEGLRLIDEGVTHQSAFAEPEVEVVVAEADEAAARPRLPQLIFDELEAMLSDQSGAFDEYVHSAAGFPEKPEDEIAASEAAEQPAAIDDAGPSQEALPETTADQETAVESDPDDSIHDPDNLIVPLRELSDQRPLSASPDAPPKDRGFAVPSFLMEVETSRSVYGPWKLATVLTAIILVLVAIAVPWGWHARNKAAKQAGEAAQSSSQTTQTDVSGSSPVNNGSSDKSEPAKKADETRSETAPEKNKSN